MLRRTTRSNFTPFSLELVDSKDKLVCEKLLRIIPGKRIVVAGTWNDLPVVAKLFIDPKNAPRQAKRDADGNKVFVAAGVNTPKLYFEGTSEDKRIQVLIFERIENAASLQHKWLEEGPDLEPLLTQLVIELATQHVFGILQHDLHLGNFLVKNNKLYAIDGGDIEFFEKPLTKKQSLTNLALFFSQLGAGTKDLRHSLFIEYARARGWRLRHYEIFYLKTALQKWNDRREKSYTEKLNRSSSAFVRKNDMFSFAMYNREYETPQLLEHLKNPEKWFLNAEVLKSGNSATLIKVSIDNKDYVVKRYNIKNGWHFLRRCLRNTRAQHCWSMAHRQSLFGIVTAKPIAFVEKRFFGLRGKSYLIMEYIPGQHAGEFFASQLENSSRHVVAERIGMLFEKFAERQIIHGDLKMTNILIAEDRPILIDLDGMEQYQNRFLFKRKFKQEIQRFMENWRTLPSTHAMFETILQG